MRPNWKTATWLGALGVIFAALCVFRLSYGPELSARGDALYDIIVADHLLKGEGFSTNLMPLGGLRVLERSGHAADVPWPSVHKFIGSQLRVAFLRLFFRSPVTAVHLSSILPHAALVAVIFVTLQRWLKSGPLAFLFALGFMAFNQLSMFAISGLNVSADSLIFALVFVAMLNVDKKRWIAPALGALVAVGVLHRYSLSLFFPFCVLAVLWSAGWRRALEVAVPCGVVLGAFILWSRIRFGLTFPSYLGESLIMHRTPYLPHDPWYVMEWPNARAVMLRDPGAFASKALRDLQGAYLAMAGTSYDLGRTVAIAAFAVVGGLHVARMERVARRVLCVLLGFAVVFSGTQLLLSASIAYLLYLVAPIWMLAALGVVATLERFRTPPVGRILIVFSVVAMIVAPDVAQARVDHRFFTRAAAQRCSTDELCNRSEVVADLRAKVPSRSIIAGGTLPWEIAAETDLNVIPIVPAPEDLLALRSKGIDVAAIFLPASVIFAGDGAAPDGWVKWAILQKARQPRFYDYVLRTTFSDGSLLYVRDRTLSVEPLPKLCPSGSAIDVRNASDAAFMGPDFHLREHDDDGHAWQWLIGRAGNAHLFTCEHHGGAAKLKLVFVPVPANRVGVSLNGTHLGFTETPREGWQEIHLDVPAGVLREGENDLRITTERVNEVGASVAIESITIE